MQFITESPDLVLHFLDNTSNRFIRDHQLILSVDILFFRDYRLCNKILYGHH